MRLVIQRVKSAQVENLDLGKTAGKIKTGLFILIGVGKSDTKKDAEMLADKVSKLRIMADNNGKMNLSVSEVKGQVLVVSQFTLYADSSKGNRPSFIHAAEPAEAVTIYKHFVEFLKSKGVDVETGDFGSYMRISAEMDGPVTILFHD